MKKKTRNRLLIAGAVVVLLVIAGLVGAAGCGDEGSDDYATGTYYDSRGDAFDEGLAYESEEALAPAAGQSIASDKNVGGGVDALDSGQVQKIVKQGTLRIEVEKGGFDSAFDQAQLLAARYGGYVVGASRYSSTDAEGEEVYLSGTVTVNVAVESFERALSEARKLGEVKVDETNTQDVTAEYVDLEARIKAQEDYVASIQALLAKAKTIDEILQVQQWLNSAQQQLEQLKGRLQYLESHTSYSTLTVNLYESGAEDVPPPGEEWGFVEALKDALHNIVDAFSAVARGLGWIIPVALVVGVLAGIGIAIGRSVTRRKKPGTGMDKDDTTTGIS